MDICPDSFFTFSAITENDCYGKMLAKVLNEETSILTIFKELFPAYKYGQDYQRILITFYLGDFVSMSKLDKPYLSNYSKKEQGWNYKIPISEGNIAVLENSIVFLKFMERYLYDLYDFLKKRKLKNFDYEVFKADIEALNRFTLLLTCSTL